MANRTHNNFIKIITVLSFLIITFSLIAIVVYGLVPMCINKPYNDHNYEIIDIPKVDSGGKKIIVNDVPKRSKKRGVRCKHNSSRKSILINCNDSDHIEILVTPKVVRP